MRIVAALGDGKPAAIGRLADAEARWPAGPEPSSARRDHGDRAVRVAQHGVPDRSRTVRAGMLAAPAHDHEVGAGGQADQGPGRVAGHDLLADRDAGILIRPALH